MDISPMLSALTSKLEESKAVEAKPEVGLVNKFSQLMQQGNQMETQLTDALNVSSTGALPSLSATSAMHLQSVVAVAVVEIDVAAKVAGAVSQGVNKLVSMQ